MERSDYPALLALLQPVQAVQVLNQRVELVSKVNTDIADWLQERRRVEEVYVQGLRRLAKKSPPDDSSELGIFSAPWNKIVTAAESLADSHHTFAQRIESDVEKPLRRFVSQSPEYKQMTGTQGHLNDLCNEIQAAQDKSDKNRKKGAGGLISRGSGAAAAADATSEFSNQAPYVFEQLQALDETRLGHLRDALTQFQTHEVDQVERERVIAEGTLNSVLNVEPADEIKTWAVRIQTSGVPTLQARDKRRTMIPSMQTSSPTVPEKPSDTRSSRSGVSESQPSRSNTAHSEEAKKSHGIAGGLKRLGTRIGRRKDKQMLNDQESPVKPSKGRFGEFNRSSSALPPRLPAADVPSPTIRPDSPSKYSSHPDEVPAKTEAKETSGISLANGIASTESSVADFRPNGQLTEPLAPQTTGSVSSVAEQNPPSAPPLKPSAFPERKDSSPRPGYLSEPSPAMSGPTNAVPPTMRQAPVPSGDLLGSENDSSSQAALASVQNALRAQQLAPPARQSGGRGRRSMYGAVPSSTSTQLVSSQPAISEEAFTAPVEPIAPRSEAPARPEIPVATPISVEDLFSSNISASSASAFPPEVPKKIEESSPALKERSSSLQDSDAFEKAPPPVAQSPPHPPPPRNSAQIPESTAESANAPSLFTASVPIAAPTAPHTFRYPSSGGLSGFNSTGASTIPFSDTASVRSSHSFRNIAALNNAPPPHADLSSFSELSCSIIETVNCTFNPDGQISSFDGHGEIACAHASDPSSLNEKPRLLKVHGQQNIDSVVPTRGLLQNAVSPSPDDDKVYEMQLSSLTAQPTVILKYQLQLTPAKREAVPILLRPVWRTDAKTISVVLNYSLNPSFVQSYPASSITVRNLILRAGISSEDPSPAIRCQSKPLGDFSVDRGINYWDLGSVTFNTMQLTGNKVVARFLLQGGSQAKPGQIEARFEVMVPMPSESGKQVEQVGLLEHETPPESKGKQRDLGGQHGDNDPFADEGEGDGATTPTPTRIKAEMWKMVKGVKKVVAGRYIVTSTASSA